MNKPDNIGLADWNILKEKYKNDLSILEDKLNKNFPIQYLIGNVDFYNINLKVDHRALIPRYETELLVEKTIEKIKKLNVNNLKVIDIGTGSGCIAISLKKNLDIDMTAIDISKEALDLAKENAKFNKVIINFIRKDILNDILEDNYDIIISNPPYVNPGEEVSKETLYEPQNALYASDNGIKFYKRIIDLVKSKEQKPRMVAFEIGAKQKDLILEYINRSFKYSEVEVIKDYNNFDRIVFISNIE